MRKQGLLSFGDTPVERKAARWLFLIGLFSATQFRIGGYIGVSEFFMVLSMPFILLQKQGLFRRDGVTKIITLSYLWLAGAIFSDFYNHNIFALMIRGWAVPICLLASIVNIYVFLRRNPIHGLKWCIIGIALSQVLSIFVLQPGSIAGSGAVAGGEMSAAEATMGYKLFWVNIAQHFLVLPIKAFYLQTPHFLAFVLGLLMAVISLLSGGRSAFAWQMMAVLFVWFGGKTTSKMRWIKRNIMPIALAMGVMLLGVKAIYKQAAQSGFMGEEEQEKYEQQAASKTMMQTLMAGRSEFFVALFAIMDKPLVGHGSVAIDYKGYRREFVLKYGNDEDIIAYEKAEKVMQSLGGGLRTIPAHSHINGYWLWHGIFGLMFWAYVIYLLGTTLMRHLHVIPAYYGYFVYGICAAFWDIFFSPFGGRVPMGLLISACLIVRAVEKDSKRMFNAPEKLW